MKKNITDIKRELVNRLLTILHRDYSSCTIYTPGVGDIVPGANAVNIRKLHHYDYMNNTSSYKYKLHVVSINDRDVYEWETTIARFEQLEPETRDQLVAFLNTKCDNAPAPFGAWLDMPTTQVGRAYYFTL